MAALDDPRANMPIPPGGAIQGEADDQFSPVVRYAGSDVVCGNCQYFDGQSQCSQPDKIADSGPDAEPGGRCEKFAEGQEQPDELQQSLQNTKPFGAGMMPPGMSNS